MWTTFSWALLRTTCLLVAASCLACASGLSKASPASDLLQRYEFEAPKLGTLFRITLFAADPAAAELAAAAAFARVDELNGILSDYDENSELSRLSAQSRHGAPSGPTPVSGELFTVLECAQSIALQTGGAFDVTVGPMTQLWRRAVRQERMPPAAELAAAVEAVGHTKIVLHPVSREITLSAPRMRLDLGGIAKGYILDEANAVLVSHGITRALIDAGGDLLASGPPPGLLAWRVEVDTGQAESRIAMPLVRAGLATSGDTYQFAMIDGERFSHIVDPRTGKGLRGSPAASVRAASAMVADAWASALCVLEPNDCIPLVDATPGVEARYLKGAQLQTSAGFVVDQ